MSRAKVTLVILSFFTVVAGACSKAPASKNTANSNAAAKTEAKKSLPPSKVVPVPANWITMVDEEKGYAFKVPEGTERQTQNVNGTEVFMAKTPVPSSISVFVIAFNDKTLSKDDLLKYASGFLEGLGEKDIKIGTPTELSDDYSLATISSVDKDGKTTKGKVLVATDVSDNYVVLLGTDESEFKENEKIMDEIWGSFSMRSGGYSGKS